MQLETRRFGTIEVADEDVYFVPNGIPGFPEMHRVTLIGAGNGPGERAGDGADAAGDDSSLFWLQDLDDGDLAFMCVVPWVAFPDYEIEIDERLLGIEDETDVRILSLISIRHEADDSGVQMTVNLRAPLVIDTRHRRLQQVILSDSRWPIRAPFVVLDTAVTQPDAPTTIAVS